MSGARFKSKLDGNHTELVRLLESMGCTFQSTAAIPGALDGIIGCAGIDIRCEFKNPIQHKSARKLTKAEQLTFDTWCGHRPIVLETDDDCVRMVHSLRKQASRNNQ